MPSYMLKIDDIGEVGSFHKPGGSHLIRVTSEYRPDVEAIIFQCILNEDNDGAPDCYGQRHPPALDPLSDATDTVNAVFNPAGHNTWLWQGVVNMRPGEAQAAGVLPRLDQTLAHRAIDGKFPLFQPPPNPNGFYVSTTATIANPNVPATDQARYWNARTVSYGVLTPPLRRVGVRNGDFGLAIRIDNGVSDSFLYADSGPQNKVGESSHYLFRNLFPDGHQEGRPVAFIVFPRSAYPDGRGSFINNPTLAILTRLGDLSVADNIDEVIGVMASGRAYRDFVLGTNPQVGPIDINTPQGQNIARALRSKGYDPEALHRRLMQEQMSRIATDSAALARQLPSLKSP